MTASGGDDDIAAALWRRALALLNRREHARQELRRKLLAGQPEGEPHVDALLDRLEAKGWLSDTRYAAARARHRAGAGQGPRRIRAELTQQGISDVAAVDALSECDTDWILRARDLLARRHSAGDLADFKVRNRALAFLLRRGFEIEQARAALALLAGETDGGVTESRPDLE